MFVRTGRERPREFKNTELITAKLIFVSSALLAGDGGLIYFSLTYFGRIIKKASACRRFWR
jgi:hypothetical protein